MLATFVPMVYDLWIRGPAVVGTGTAPTDVLYPSLPPATSPPPPRLLQVLPRDAGHLGRRLCGLPGGAVLLRHHRPARVMREHMELHPCWRQSPGAAHYCPPGTSHFRICTVNHHGPSRAISFSSERSCVAFLPACAPARRRRTCRVSCGETCVYTPPFPQVQAEWTRTVHMNRVL